MPADQEADVPDLWGKSHFYPMGKIRKPLGWKHFLNVIMNTFKGVQ